MTSKRMPALGLGALKAKMNLAIFNKIYRQLRLVCALVMMSGFVFAASPAVPVANGTLPAANAELSGNSAIVLLDKALAPGGFVTVEMNRDFVDAHPTCGVYAYLQPDMQKVVVIMPKNTDVPAGTTMDCAVITAHEADGTVSEVLSVIVHDGIFEVLEQDL